METHRNLKYPNLLTKNGRLLLRRCFACPGYENSEKGRENYALNVYCGQCAWCGWSHTNEPSVLSHDNSPTHPQAS